MKYFPLVWAGIWRKKIRTALTMFSVAVAFVLFGLLQGINMGMDAAVRSLHLDRLYVMNRVNGTWPQPITNIVLIRAIPGVTRVGHWSYFAGFFQDPHQPVPSLAVDVSQLFELYPEIVLTQPEQLAMLRTRTGVIIGRQLARRFGWKVGDHIPLGSLIWKHQNGDPTWYFDVVGIYDVHGRSTVDPDTLFLSYDYLDEGRGHFGIVHTIVVSISDPRQSQSISRKIDALFMNSASQTRTRSEQVYAHNQMREIGDVGIIANAIVSAALFALLFVTANTMMQSVRERTAEFAVLKTLGFRDFAVLLLVLAESTFICVAAAAIGLLVARASYSKLSVMFGSVDMPVSVITAGLAIALLVGLLSAAVPAWRVMRLSVVDALAAR